MRKKMISGALCTALLASGVSPVLAAPSSEVKVENMKTAALQQAMEEAEITREEALKIAKEFVDVSEEFQQENVRFDSHFNGIEQEKRWEIDWSKQGRNFEHLSVSVDAETGDVTRMRHHKDSEDEERSFPPKVDFEEAISIAESYIEEKYSDQVGELMIDEDNKERMEDMDRFRQRYEYDIHFHQVKNGVPYPNNQIRVSVTGNGDVNRVYYNWEKVDEFEEAQNVLSNEEAFKRFKEMFDVELRYGVNTYMARQGEEVQAYLTYVPASKDRNEPFYHVHRLDAETGEPLNREGIPLDEVDEEDRETYELSDEPVAEDVTPLQELDEELTQEKAMEVVKEAVNVPEKYELSNARYEDEEYYRTDHPSWRFSWLPKNQRDHRSEISATVDAKTGELLNYDNRKFRYYEGVPEDFEVNVTKDEAKETALEFVKKAASSKLDQLYMETTREEIYGNDREDPVAYSVNFVRKVDGLIVNNQNVRITVSADTGDVTDYYIRWNDVDFPEQDNVIAKEEVRDLFLEKYDLKLMYFTPYSKEERERSDEAILTYQANFDHSYNRPTFFDAKEGVWVNQETMEPVKEESKEVTDIDGHPAEDALRTLIDYNMLEVEDGKVNPDQVLTRSDLLELVLKGLGYDNVYYGRTEELPFEDVEKGTELYRQLITAVERGFIDGDEDKFLPDQEAEREYVAKLLVKALGYDKLAGTEGVFEADYSDADDMEYEGHVALATRLGLMKGENGSFDPNESITKAEAAVSLLKFLEIEPTLNENRY